MPEDFEETIRRLNEARRGADTWLEDLQRAQAATSSNLSAMDSVARLMARADEDRHLIDTLSTITQSAGATDEVSRLVALTDQNRRAIEGLPRIDIPSAATDELRSISLSQAAGVFEQAMKDAQLVNHGIAGSNISSEVDRSLAAINAQAGVLDFVNTNSAVQEALSAISSTAGQMQAATPQDVLDIMTSSRSFIGPLSEISNMIEHGTFIPKSLIEASRNFVESYDGLFIKPNASLMDDFFHSNRDVLTLAAQIDTPWLRASDMAVSAQAFSELADLARHAVILEPFGDDLMNSLRRDLGDWRDAIIPAVPDLSEIALRSRFYVERGFRPDLTDFPAEAFDETLEKGELTRDAPTLIEQYGNPIDPDRDEDISAFARTNQAHYWLMRLETQIRSFMDRLLTESFGPDWPRRQLPNGMYDGWLIKQRKSEAHGMPKRPVIAFIDFSEYEIVITKRDNWKIFKPFFHDPANVREAFRRLSLPRHETMHGRPLSQDDQLFLYVEIKRLARSFRRG
jgi:hypothetical protein